MSAFDELLAQYEAPSADDIVLPVRAGTPGGKADGSKDISGGNTPAGTGAASSAAPAGPAGTAPEPAPQLPEGSDDDEEKAAAEAGAEAAEEAEQEAARQRAAAEETPAGEEAEPAGTAEPAGDDTAVTVPDSGSKAAPQAGEQQYPVIPRKGAGLTFEGESAYLKQFPRALIDQMREILKPSLGDAFARDLSQVSIVTAFVVAAMGVELTTDEHTARAVQAFRENDPRADLLEKRTESLLELQEKCLRVMKDMVLKTGQLIDTAAVLEMGQAYALAERTAVLKTDGVLPESIDVTQKRALASRDNIRKRVREQQKLEKERAGRPLR